MLTLTMTDRYQRVRTLAPGMAVSITVAAAATFLAEHYGAPVLLFALLLGMGLNFLSAEGTCKAGIEFTARSVLRIGVALLGMRITLGQIAELGWMPVLLVVTLVVVTISLSVVAARLMGFQRLFGMLTGGGDSHLRRLRRPGPGRLLAQSPPEGARHPVHRDRGLGALDPGDDPLPHDRPLFRADAGGGRGLPRRHHPRRRPGGGSRLQHVHRDG